MTGIADILYVRFRVPDLNVQQKFLDDFGCITRRENGTLLARGTDANPFIYAAEQGEAAFLGLGFEVLSKADLERIAAIDSVPVTTNKAPGGSSWSACYWRPLWFPPYGCPCSAAPPSARR